MKCMLFLYQPNFYHIGPGLKMRNGDGMSDTILNQAHMITSNIVNHLRRRNNIIEVTPVIMENILADRRITGDAPVVVSQCIAAIIEIWSHILIDHQT